MPDHPDALVDGLAHRRASGLNPANRFEATRFHADGDALDVLAAERDDTGRLRRVPLTVVPDATRRIIHRVDRASDMPFDWTLNPYRGCEHGCIYCYARPYHELLGYSCGLDFETKIVAKHEAPRLLVKELGDPRWRPEPIVMSAITDVYQPIEAKLQLTRQCLEILAAARQPTSTMTKGSLVLRDLDLWQELAAHDAGRVTVTIVTLDATLAKTLEPRAAAPAVRLKMIRELAAAGVPVSVNVAPVIPGLTDVEVPAILEAIAEAGGTRVNWVMLRLPWQLKALFLDWLRRNVHPSRARRVESLLRQMHAGKLYRADDRRLRGRGRGAIAESIKATFTLFTHKHGLDGGLEPMSADSFVRPSLPGGQLGLFGG